MNCGIALFFRPESVHRQEAIVLGRGKIFSFSFSKNNDKIRKKAVNWWLLFNSYLCKVQRLCLI